MERFARGAKRTIAAILLMILLPVSALADYAAVVSTDRMKVYSTNKVNDKYYLGYLRRNTEFTVVATSGSWARITYQGRTGYAQLKDMKQKTPQTKKLAYTKEMTKVYQKASSSSKVIDTLTPDYPVYIVGTSGRYYQVTNYDGKGSGYVRQTSLSDTKPNFFALSDDKKGSYSSSNSSTYISSSVKSKQEYVAASMGREKYIEYIIYAAQSRIGCKYSSSPNNNTTFKNASFVKACFNTLGFDIPSTINSIGHGGNAQFVSRRELKRGDIVCFDCEGGNDDIIDHVGIYLGNGYFIHASNAAGMVVVSRMNSGYYYKNFCWGRRYV